MERRRAGNDGRLWGEGARRIQTVEEDDSVRNVAVTFRAAQHGDFGVGQFPPHDVQVAAACAAQMRR